MRFALIDRAKSEFPVQRLCSVLGVSQSGYFAYRGRQASKRQRENMVLPRQRRRFKRTTDSEHPWPVAPNLIDQDFTATAPNEKWGVDISYVWTREGRLYLAVVIDLFSRRMRRRVP